MRKFMNELFPHRRDFSDGRFAYIIPLTFGRGRINLSVVGEEMSVQTAW